MIALYYYVLRIVAEGRKEGRKEAFDADIYIAQLFFDLSYSHFHFKAV